MSRRLPHTTSTTCRILTLLILTLLQTVGGAARADESDDAQRRLPCGKPVFGLIRMEFDNTNCRNIIQDQKGYIWVGTDNGLVRYDGAHIDRFANTDAGLLNSGRKILAMAEDTANCCIWASIDGTASLAKIDTRTFETTILEYQTSEDNGSDAYRITLSLTNANDSTLICRMARAFYSISKKTGHAELLLNYKGPINNSRSSFFNFGGRMCNVGGGRLYAVSADPSLGIRIEQVSLCGLDCVKDAVPKDDSTLIVMNMSGQRKFDIYHVRPQSNTKQLIGSLSDSPHGMAAADDGLWVATNHGLTFITYADGKQRTFNSANSTLQDNDIACITKARGQHIFFMGTADGIVTLNYFNSKFIRTDMRRYSMSSNPQVWSLAQDSRGTHWVGCIDGLYKLRSNSVFYEKVEIANAKAKAEVDEMVLSINETNERDGLFISTPKDVYKIAYDGRVVRHVMHDDDLIRCTQPTADGRLIITCRRGIHILNISTWREISSLTPPNGQGFNTSRTDDGKTLWVANNSQEISGYDLATLERKYIVLFQKDSIGVIRDIRHNVANGMDELWIATSNGGLLYKNPGYSGTMPINSGKVLKSRIHSLELDADGGLWVSTDLGIANVKDGKVTDFPKDEFLLCNKFINRASAKGPDGTILMGGRNDFIEFEPLSFINNDYFPTPVVTSYQYFNFTQSPEPGESARQLYGDKPIVVPADVNSIRLNARSLSYDHPEQTNVEWMMDDDFEWKKTEDSGDIYLVAITEGEHNLYLRSTDDQGRPQAGICALTLKKRMLFHESRLFIVVLVLAGIAIIAGLWLWRNSQFKQMRVKLMRDVNMVSDMLMTANSELRKRQEEVNKRNEEISAMNTNLQEMVERRTHDYAVAKAKAEESSQLKSDFLASLGHEVRTPMNAIIGFAKLLHMKECPEEERIEFADLILKSANSLLGMLGALLDSSRIERGVLEISNAPTNLHQEVNDAYRMLSVEKRNPNVEFTLDLADNLKGAVIDTDKERLRQIIINITYNAFKFTAKGHVKMSAWKAKASGLTRIGLPNFPQSLSFTSDVFVMSIEDTGVGIPEDKRDIIFEPFRRLSENTIKHPGLGLGLNIVKNLVTLMGGEIWLTSEVGKGSTFFFYLPFERPKTDKK